MNSNYGMIIAQVENLKCKHCYGYGYFIFKSSDKFCSKCNGTGWSDGKEKKLIHNKRLSKVNDHDNG